MHKLRNEIIGYFGLWFVVAIICTLLCGLVYLTVQQSQRSSANDPQVQMAEDAATVLAQGRQPKEFETAEKIEISRSLAPYIVVFDAQGQPIASSGVLDGRMPILPSGVFEFTRSHRQDRISWQPRAGVRSALVIIYFRGNREGFVAAGRSLREVEQREAYTLKAAAWCWLVSLVLTFLAVAFFLLASREKFSLMEKYDVVIIGAGLAGLQCARLLGRAGARVLLADRKHTLDERIHTTGIFVRRTLEDFDLPKDCLGAAVRHVTLYSPRGRTLELESPHDEFRVGRMGRLYTRFLEQCLDDKVAWAHGTRYAGCEASKEGSIIHFETSGKRWRVQARYIIGADGAQSRVGGDLGLDKNSKWIVGVEEVFSAAPSNNQPRFHCFLDPVLAPGYLAWVVNDGEEVHIGVGGYAIHFDPLQALEKFKRRVADGIFEFEKAVRLERRGGRIPVGGILKNLANERGLLVGDAAGAVSPLTAGGLDPCMRLSQLAARVIADYLTTRDRQVLRDYAGEKFRARFVSRLWMRRLLANVRQPLLLETACSVLSLPVFKSLAWHVFFGRGSFPDVDALGARSMPVVKFS